MNTLVTHQGITFNLSMNEPPFEIKGRGWAHPAKLECDTTRTELAKLIGLKLWDLPILAVESFAIESQNHTPISLLLEKKLW